MARGENFAKRVAALTDNKFQIRVFAAGEIVPGLQVVDAVQNGTVECGHTASYYYVGKDPTFAFDTAIPFGLNTRQHNAWMYCGGGLELMREFFKDYNMTSFLWQHRRPDGRLVPQGDQDVEDLKGLKMRIGGFAGQVMAKLGVVPQQIAGGEIYPALEKGTIDAAEWVGPYDDQKLGFNKVAPYYYYPGWWEGGAALSLYCGDKAYEALPAMYKEAIAAAAGDTVSWSVAKYDAQNPKALRELVAAGTKLLPFPQPVMEACFNAANELYAETIAKNAKFKKVYDPGRRSATRRCCGSASPRTPSTTSWRASRPPTSSEPQKAGSAVGKAPLRRGFFFAAFALRMAGLIPPGGISAGKQKFVLGVISMQRRKFLRTAGIGGGAAVVASTSRRQPSPNRCRSSSGAWRRASPSRSTRCSAPARTSRSSSAR